MAKLLDGKVAIITGGNSGIGAATVACFLEQGAKVVVLDIADPAASTDSSRHDIKCNITSEDAVNKAVKETLDKFGGLDILVNCAGVMDGFERVGDTPTEVWNKVMGINVNGAFYLIRACVPHFLSKTEGVTKGSIVNICSVAARGGGAAGAAYTTSKHALLGLTRSTSWMYRNDGIRCNAVLPGGVSTNIYQNSNVTLNPAGHQSLAPYHACGSTTPMNPSEIANAIMFLASSDKINGAELAIDEGWTSA